MYQITLLERQELLDVLDAVIAQVEPDENFPQALFDKLEEQRKVLGVK